MPDATIAGYSSALADFLLEYDMPFIAFIRSRKVPRMNCYMAELTLACVIVREKSY